LITPFGVPTSKTAGGPQRHSIIFVKFALSAISRPCAQRPQHRDGNRATARIPTSANLVFSPIVRAPVDHIQSPLSSGNLYLVQAPLVDILRALKSRIPLIGRLERAADDETQVHRQ
jgi:hypothetical protein